MCISYLLSSVPLCQAAQCFRRWNFLNILTAYTQSIKVKLSLSMSWRHIGEAHVQLHPFLTSELDGIQQSIAHHCGLANKKKPWYPWNRSLHRPQGSSRHFGEEINIFLLPGFNPWAIQPQLRHYTAYTNLAPQLTFHN